MKPLLILFGILLATALIIFGLVNLGENEPVLTANLTTALESDDNVWGNGKIVLIEYSDFQCPACAAYWPLLKKLKADFADDLSFVYRHFPLRNIHPNADIAAQAVQAAGLQGKFWEMADKVFIGQSDWNESKNADAVLESYAKELNLDLPKFKEDLNSQAVKDKIEKNYREAKSLNLPGTPSFFLNGKAISNPRSYGEFKNLIEKELGR